MYFHYMGDLYVAVLKNIRGIEGDVIYPRTWYQNSIFALYYEPFPHQI